MSQATSKKANKIKLASILFYRPTPTDQPKIAPDPTFDSDGNIKHLNVVMVGKINPSLLEQVQASKISDSPAGIGVGSVRLRVRGRSVNMQLIYCLGNQGNEKLDKVAAYSSNFNGIKSFIIVFNCNSDEFQHLQDLILRLRELNHKNQNYLVLSIAQPRNQDRLNMAFQLAKKYGFLYAEVPLMGNFVSTLEKLYLVKSLQLGLQEDSYQKQVQMIKKEKVELIGHIQGEQNKRDTEIWKLGQFWEGCVLRTYCLIEEILNILEEASQFVESTKQKYINQQSKQNLQTKIAQIQSIIQLLSPHNQIDDKADFAPLTSSSAEEENQASQNIYNQIDGHHGREDLCRILAKLFDERQQMAKKRQMLNKNRQKSLENLKNKAGELDVLVGSLMEVRDSIQIMQICPQSGLDDLTNYQKSEGEKQEQKKLRTKILLQCSQIPKFVRLIKECQQILAEENSRSHTEDLTKDQPESSNPLDSLIDYFVGRKLAEYQPYNDERNQKFEKKRSSSAFESQEQQGERQAVDQIGENVRIMKVLVQCYQAVVSKQKLNSIENNRYKLAIIDHNLGILGRIKYNKSTPF